MTSFMDFGVNLIHDKTIPQKYHAVPGFRGLYYSADKRLSGYIYLKIYRIDILFIRHKPIQTCAQALETIFYRLPGLLR